MAYLVQINTSKYKPLRCSKKTWEKGTTNDHMKALNGFKCTERNLTEVGWRLHMFAGTSPGWDIYDTPDYKSWVKQDKNTITYHDKLCNLDRQIKICPPGFKQGYINIPGLLDALERDGRIEVPFSAVYDIRQYMKNMDGCVLTVEEIPRDPEPPREEPNYQVMPESYKNSAGFYIPDFDALMKNASCDDERTYIAKVCSQIQAGTFSGFRWNMVYITKMTCGHYEIFQTPANKHYPIEENLKLAQEHAADSKCSHCITNWQP